MRYILVLYLLFAVHAHALINGKPLKGFRDLVKITFGSGNSICTGFFVNPTMVITAAHCFYSYEDGKILEVRGLETFDNEMIDVKVVSLLPHPDYYKGGWSPNDIGLIETTPNRYFRGSFSLQESSAPFMGYVRMMGAGKISLKPKQYGRSEGTNYYVLLGAFFYSVGGTSVAPNDSGGPLLADNKVIGILSKTTADWVEGTIFPTISVMTPIGSEANKRFIEMHVLDKR